MESYIYKTLFLIPFSFFDQLKLSVVYNLLSKINTFHCLECVNTIALILSLLDSSITAMSSCQEEDSRRTKGLLGTIDGTIGTLFAATKVRKESRRLLDRCFRGRRNVVTTAA